jgi:hypothetical protein
LQAAVVLTALHFQASTLVQIPIVVPGPEPPCALEPEAPSEFDPSS